MIRYYITTVGTRTSSAVSDVTLDQRPDSNKILQLAPANAAIPFPLLYSSLLVETFG